MVHIPFGKKLMLYTPASLLYNTPLDRYSPVLRNRGVINWNSVSPEVRGSNTLQEYTGKIVSRTKNDIMFHGHNRRLNIIHTQFRLLCSDLKADLCHLHVVEDVEDPTCICSSSIED